MFYFTLVMPTSEPEFFHHCFFYIKGRFEYTTDIGSRLQAITNANLFPPLYDIFIANVINPHETANVIIIIILSLKLK